MTTQNNSEKAERFPQEEINLDCSASCIFPGLLQLVGVCFRLLAVQDIRNFHAPTSISIHGVLRDLLYLLWGCRSGIRSKLLSELHGNAFLERCSECNEEFFRWVVCFEINEFKSSLNPMWMICSEIHTSASFSPASRSFAYTSSLQKWVKNVVVSRWVFQARSCSRGK